jgi:hypothetical protein
MNRLRVASAVLAAAIAVSAYAGVVGLVGGGITFGEDIDQRLPWDSHVLAGVALLLFVALPMTAAAVALWRRTPHSVDLLEAAGVVLVVWIAVELAFIRAYSWFHPTYLLIAVAVVVAAMVLRAASETPSATPSAGVRKRGA